MNICIYIRVEFLTAPLPKSSGLPSLRKVPQVRQGLLENLGVGPHGV